MKRISHSVGLGGTNLPHDVAAVQALLNRHRTAASPLLAVDKRVGPRTIAAIKEFQARVVKMPQPDGRVDPQGGTVEFLYASPALVGVRSVVDYLLSLAAGIETQFKKAAAGFATLAPANLYSTHHQVAWGAKVSPEFKAKVIQICERLDIDPDHLMTCMAFETAETFSPSKKNPGSSGTGLIQFMAKTAKGLKTTVEELAAMSDMRQLDYVEEYFKGKIKTYKKLSTLEDVYFAILNPIGIHQADDFVIFQDGTGDATKQEQYEKNKGLDKNKDGRVPVAEVAVKIRAMYRKGISPGYLG